jgi:uncharacterized membrane protein YeiH
MKLPYILLIASLLLKKAESFQRIISSHNNLHSKVLRIRGGQLDEYNLLENANTIHNKASLLRILTIIGTGFFSFSGALTAARKGMDLVGVMILATITAVGGGTIRDVLLMSGTPVFWIEHPVYIQTCVLVSILTFFLWPTLEKRFRWKDSSCFMCTVDAIGVSAFAILGAQKAEAMELDPSIWIVSGLITATFGGVVRDVLCLNRPRLMYPHRTLYAPGPILGSVVYTILVRKSGSPTQHIAWISFLVAFLTRILSFNNRIRLPHWKSIPWQESLHQFGR